MVDCVCLGESKSGISCMISKVALLMRYLAR
jgi:hypothetical protein